MTMIFEQFDIYSTAPRKSNDFTTGDSTVSSGTMPSIAPINFGNVSITKNIRGVESLGYLQTKIDKLASISAIFASNSSTRDIFLLGSGSEFEKKYFDFINLIVENSPVAIENRSCNALFYFNLKVFNDTQISFFRRNVRKKHVFVSHFVCFMMATLTVMTEYFITSMKQRTQKNFIKFTAESFAINNKGSYSQKRN
jgi:hypothetical protein